MVSLADIAFLIIFFFFLSSQFMKDKTEIKLPKIPRTAETQSQITVSMDAKGNMRLNGDEVTIGTLETELHKLLEGKQDHQVRFNCDKDVTNEKYTPVYEAISNAGGDVAVMQDVIR